jgi:hypothetical protein
MTLATLYQLAFVSSEPWLVHQPERRFVQDQKVSEGEHTNTFPFMQVQSSSHVVVCVLSSGVPPDKNLSMPTFIAVCPNKTALATKFSAHMAFPKSPTWRQFCRRSEIVFVRVYKIIYQPLTYEDIRNVEEEALPRVGSVGSLELQPPIISR